METIDVVVVGGAIVGSAAAYFLACEPSFRGSVLVLEKDASYQHCATGRSAASIRHQFSTPENIQASQFGTAFIREAGSRLAIDGETPDVGFREAGYLFLAQAAQRGVLEANHRIQRELGVHAALLAPDAIAERFPWLATGDLDIASLGLSGEGWLDAYGLMRALRRKAIALGARYRESEVTGLVRQGRRITHVEMSDGSRVACSLVINAAGSGAREVARSAGIALPVESRKRCVFHFTSPARLPNCPLVIDPAGAWFRPEGDGFICGISPPDDPECVDFEVDHSLWDEVLWPALAQRVPGFEAARVRHAWAGHYDVHPLDHNVILGAHPEVDNLLFANGFSGHGLQQAPAVGRALAELVVHGGFRTLDLTRLGWQRVIEGRPLREVNVV
ncbi:FAD-dependent oxidoreductase [Piscinibacter sp. XHJ-5]|uniref:NAD(P)/FAD-dependent oxidoreductase n=1 Tax=Piscinibacter sp. XHJ-5 TaxID=3037797 RepID=UPI0024532F22|nr:FAD-dependent oxidoreductase [Piscinibacter sp. XHJ-5]